MTAHTPGAATPPVDCPAHTVCWITDFYAAQCRAQACVHAPNPPHPCLPETGEEVVDDVTR